MQTKWKGFRNIGDRPSAPPFSILDFDCIPPVSVL